MEEFFYRLYSCLEARDMKHLNKNNKRKNITIVTAVLLGALVVAVGTFSVTTSIIIQSAQAYIDPVHDLERPT
jgi:hypothetical protein